MKAIMYHYVRPDDPGLPYFRHLHLDDFRRQLDFLSESFRLPARDEFLEALRSRRPLTEAVLLTFDDGLKDHYRYVLPELKSRGLWGIFYVSTGVYRTRRLLDVHRTHLLLGRWGGGSVLDALLPLVGEHMLCSQRVEEFRRWTYRRQANDQPTLQVKRLLNYFIDYTWRGRLVDALMDRFYGDGGPSVEQFYLTADELRQMHHAGMLLGSHTVSHPVMRRLSAQEQAEEIDLSFAFLDATVGRLAARTFCYPYGGFHTFTPETERLLVERGCEFSFNVEPRDICAADLADRPQALPRYDCNQFPHGACRRLQAA